MKASIKRILSTFFLLPFSVIVFTQNNRIDSLKRVVESRKDDFIKVDMLLQIDSLFLKEYQFENALVYANKSLSLAQKIGYQKGEAKAFAYAGLVYGYQDNLLEALKNFMNSLKAAEILKDKKLMADMTTGIAKIYGMQEDYPEALKYYYRSLRQWEELKNEKLIAITMSDIGFVLHAQGNYSEALASYKKALEIFEKTGQKDGIADACISMAIIYSAQGNYQDALINNSVALKIYEEAGNKADMFFVFQNIGNINEQRGDVAYSAGEKERAGVEYIEALRNYNKELESAIIGNDTGLICMAYADLGKIHTKLRRYSRAGIYLKKSMRLAKNSKENNRIVYRALSKLDSAQGKFDLAYKHYKKYVLYRDSLVNEEHTRKSVSYKMQYEFDKREDQIKILSIQNKLQIAVAAKENQSKNIAFAGIGVILLAGGYGFYRFRKRKKHQSQQALMNERLRISRELHDEVGATLSGIAMYSHLTKEQVRTANTSDAERSLDIMQQSAGDMVNKLNDIVWMVNPEQDSLQKLVQRLEEYACDMAMVKDMKVKVNVPDKLHDMAMPVESRRNIYLFCKEAINNAVKYSGGTLLELSINETNSELEISVSDNGKGFDPERVKRGNGLENMQKRADEINARFMIQSKPGEGTRISVLHKIT